MNQKVLKNLRAFGLLLFFLGGCGQSYETSLVEWNNALKKDSLSRLSTISSPSLVEKNQLEGLDHRYSLSIEGAEITDRYDSPIEKLKTRVAMASSVEIKVVTDLRMAPIPFRGGVTLHGRVYLDGKFLDILSEYANYLVLSKEGLSALSRVEALDFILSSHMSEYGKEVEKIHFPSYQLSPSMEREAKENFLELLGAQLYHEFGHYYLYHSLQKFRAERKRQSGLPLKESEHLCLSSSWNEDSADRIMGILSRKAGYGLLRLKEWIDILVFYSERSHNPTLSFKEVLTPTFQYRQSPPYSALITRKEMIEEGYFLYSEK